MAATDLVRPDPSDSLRRTPVSITASFKKDIASRAYESEEVFEGDSEDEEESESEIEGDDDLSWEDEDETFDPASVKEHDSRPDLTSRRSLLTRATHEPDRAAALQNLASRCTPAIKRSRTSTPNSQSFATSPKEGAEFEIPGVNTMRVKPIIVTPSNTGIPIVPMSPRTTRRNMLSSEMTESLRKHLLWEKQYVLLLCKSTKTSLLEKVADVDTRRRHSVEDLVRPASSSVLRDDANQKLSRPARLANPNLPCRDPQQRAVEVKDLFEVEDDKEPESVGVVETRARISSLSSAGETRLLGEGDMLGLSDYALHEIFSHLRVRQLRDGSTAWVVQEVSGVWNHFVLLREDIKPDTTFVECCVELELHDLFIPAVELPAWSFDNPSAALLKLFSMVCQKGKVNLLFLMVLRQISVNWTLANVHPLMDPMETALESDYTPTPK